MKKGKKILIISYFFPPANFPGSYRVKSWADHLFKSGYFPVIISRHWSGKETEYTTPNFKKETEFNKYNNYSVFRLAYRGSFRDRLVQQYGDWVKVPLKALSLLQLIIQNYSLKWDPMADMYFEARKYIIKHPEVETVLISGRPFIQFRYGYLLKKEFPHIHWVADYRDAWNTASTINDNFQRRIQRFFEKPLEKKWLQSASLVTAVSSGIANEVSALIKKPVAVIYNGFEPADYSDSTFSPAIKKPKENFRIVYTGSLYPWQAIGDFLQAFKSTSEGIINILEIKLIFVGTKPNKILEEFIKTNPLLNIEITPKVPKEVAIQYQKQADLLLMLGHKNRKGILSSKIFEYLGTGRPVFLCASDDEELTDIVRRTRSGFIARNSKEIQETLKKICKEYLENGFVSYAPEEEEVAFFTRESQTRRLAEAMEKIQG